MEQIAFKMQIDPDTRAQAMAHHIRFGKLGGFRFNDSIYGDDDLDSRAIDPYR